MNEGTRCTLHGKNIVHMTQGSNTLHFFYDASNKPAIVEYNGSKYAYVHNLQGDIVAILDSNSNKVVEYKYDAWGKPISKTGSMKDSLGTLNPFRYRGYVYDEETGLYYLRSRYYDAYKCCFINADALINGNLYAYCENSPIVHEDNNGYALCCCLDDNGFETTLMSHFMFGGSCGGGSGSAVVGISAALGQRKSIQQRAASKEVSFMPEEDGKGGCIANSYKLLPWEMFEYTQYLKKQYGDIYSGSDIGFYFEWTAHNLGYYGIEFANVVIDIVEPLITQEDLRVAAKLQESLSDFNFGATIYNDYEDHGMLSFLFFVPYGLLYRIHSIYDLIAY